MVVMVGLLAVGCTVPAAGPRLVPIAAAPAVGPATAAPATTTFTRPGVPDAPVRAIIGDIPLYPNTNADQRDGSVRHPECRSRTYVDYVRRVPGGEGATGEFRIPDEESGLSALVICEDSFVLLMFSESGAPERRREGRHYQSGYVHNPWACNGQPIPGLGAPLGPVLPESTPTPRKPCETHAERGVFRRPARGRCGRSVESIHGDAMMVELMMTELMQLW